MRELRRTWSEVDELSARQLLALWRVRGELATQRWSSGQHTSREALDVLASAGQLARHRRTLMPTLEEQVQQTHARLEQLIEREGLKLSDAVVTALRLDGWLERAAQLPSGLIWAGGTGHIERDLSLRLFDTLERAVLAQGELGVHEQAEIAQAQGMVLSWANDHPERFLPAHAHIRATLCLIDPAHESAATQILTPLYEHVEELRAGELLLEQLARSER